MAEDPGNFLPPGAEDEDEVFGKLDQLLNRHRPGIGESGSGPVPELTDSLHRTDTPVPGNIPTLVDKVGGPTREPTLPQRPGTIQSANSKAVLEAGINLRLAVRLEMERARLLEQFGNDPLRARAVDELITELKRSLPALVRSVFSDEPSRE